MLPIIGWIAITLISGAVTSGACYVTSKICDTVNNTVGKSKEAEMLKERGQQEFNKYAQEKEQRNNDEIRRSQQIANDPTTSDYDRSQARKRIRTLQEENQRLLTVQAHGDKIGTVWGYLPQLTAWNMIKFLVIVLVSIGLWRLIKRWFIDPFF